MQLNQVQNQVLAILFACGEPIEPQKISQALGLELHILQRVIITLEEYLEQAGLPLQIIRLEDKCQLTTRGEYAPIIKQALEIRRNAPLSQAALEVLAIVAYNQPVTKAFIEQVRGVDSSGVVGSLAEKGLIEEAGRLELPGRPISYKTTPAFLRVFGISSLEQLPALAPQPQEEEPEDLLELPEDDREPSLAIS